jgi:Flp pilus assembly protein TadD
MRLLEVMLKVAKAKVTAPAWALRASVQNTMATVSLIDVTERFRSARDDAERAIALDPDSASAYLALATTQIFYDWNWDSANTCLTKAASLEPGNSDVFHLRSLFSALMGNMDEAVKFREQAVCLDPLDNISRLQLGYRLYMVSRYDEAHAELQKALQFNPRSPFAHFILAQILIAEEKPQQALGEIEKEPSKWGKLTGQALVYQALGREQDSTAALASLSRRMALTLSIRSLRCMRSAGRPTTRLNGWSVLTNNETPGCPRSRSIRY